MTNLEQLNSLICEVFSVDSDVLNGGFDNTSVDNWDSVHQLSLTAGVEDIFDIMLDPEDIIMFTSYENIKQVLMKYGIEL